MIGYYYLETFVVVMNMHFVVNEDAFFTSREMTHSTKSW